MAAKIKTLQHGYSFGMGKEDQDWYVCVPVQHWKDKETVTVTCAVDGKTKTFPADSHVKEMEQTRPWGNYKVRYYLWDKYEKPAV